MRNLAVVQDQVASIQTKGIEFTKTLVHNMDGTKLTITEFVKYCNKKK